MKALTIRMTDSAGTVYRWTIQRVPRAINLGAGNGPIGRVITGWEYTDHEGYTRFSEGNWFDLVGAVKRTIENYGLTLLSGLS